MATYLIGDVQGCYEPFERLLARISFDPARDRLLLCGDLVNRGGEDLLTLRWLVRHQDAVEAVLGNHDLHLLACAEGLREVGAHDTFGEVLGAPDAGRLLEWLRHRPLLHREGDVTLVHAGLLPEWSVEEAAALARGLEAEIRGGALGSLLATPPPEGPWGATSGPRARARLALDAFVSLRLLHPDGRLARGVTSPPEAAPGLVPWFRFPGRRSEGERLAHGHWAALGVRLSERVLSLDGGCVWGGVLCALRLEDGARFEVPGRRDRRA